METIVPPNKLEPYDMLGYQLINLLLFFQDFFGNSKGRKVFTHRFLQVDSEPKALVFFLTVDMT